MGVGWASKTQPVVLSPPLSLSTWGGATRPKRALTTCPPVHPWGHPGAPPRGGQPAPCPGHALRAVSHARCVVDRKVSESNRPTLA